MCLEGTTPEDKEKYNIMSHISLTYHIVWRTKRNKNTIREQYERELYAYILGICQSKGSRLHRINSMPDHIHLCVEVSPTIALSSEDNVRATSTKCRMEREMVCQMSSDILGYMSHHRSRYS